LTGKPGDPIVRQADVIVLTDGKANGAVVDISDGKVESYAEIKGAQAPLLVDDQQHCAFKVGEILPGIANVVSAGVGFPETLGKVPQLTNRLGALFRCGCGQGGLPDLLYQRDC
jgi:hypothetical protein